MNPPTFSHISSALSDGTIANLHAPTHLPFENALVESGIEVSLGNRNNHHCNTRMQIIRNGYADASLVVSMIIAKKKVNR